MEVHLMIRSRQLNVFSRINSFVISMADQWYLDLFLEIWLHRHAGSFYYKTDEPWE